MLGYITVFRPPFTDYCVPGNAQVLVTVFALGPRGDVKTST